MSGQKTILVVDDEKDLVEMIKVKLESGGYKTDVAFDGKEGLDKAKALKPDLILLDVMMPQLNGYQVCRELKGNDELKHIPVVMLTAKSQESDKFWGLEVGADSYVTKPFEFDDLMKILKKYLSK